MHHIDCISTSYIIKEIFEINYYPIFMTFKSFRQFSMKKNVKYEFSPTIITKSTFSLKHEKVTTNNLKSHVDF